MTPSICLIYWSLFFKTTRMINQSLPSGTHCRRINNNSMVSFQSIFWGPRSFDDKSICSKSHKTRIMICCVLFYHGYIISFSRLRAYFPIYLRVDSLVLEQSYDWSSANAVIMKNIPKSLGHLPQQNIAKREACANLHISRTLLCITEGGEHTAGSKTVPWWRYEMETLAVLLALCKGNLPVDSP